MENETPALLPLQQWARLAGIGRDAAYRLTREGRLRHMKVGRRILVPRSELVAFPEREAVEATG